MTPKKSKSDPDQFAADIVSKATEEVQDPSEELKKQAAAILGRLGGLKGGPTRAKKLTRARRVEIARRGAKKRWSKKSSVH